MAAFMNPKLHEEIVAFGQRGQLISVNANANAASTSQTRSSEDAPLPLPNWVLENYKEDQDHRRQQCKGVTKQGKRCRCRQVNAYCKHHVNQDNASASAYRLDFGMHRGKLLDNVPQDYLNWIRSAIEGGGFTNRPRLLKALKALQVLHAKQEKEDEEKATATTATTYFSGLHVSSKEKRKYIKKLIKERQQAAKERREARKASSSSSSLAAIPTQVCHGITKKGTRCCRTQVGMYCAQHATVEKCTGTVAEIPEKAKAAVAADSNTQAEEGDLFIVYDFETTGLGARQDISIMQVGAVAYSLRCESGSESLTLVRHGEFQKYVQPWKRCSAGAENVHHISSTVLAEHAAQSWQTVGLEWFAWMEELRRKHAPSKRIILSGFNSRSYDTPILVWENERAGIHLPSKLVLGDYKKMMARLPLDVPKKKNGKDDRRLVGYYAAAVPSTVEAPVAHDALGDCVMVVMILEHVLAQTQAQVQKYCPLFVEDAHVVVARTLRSGKGKAKASK